MIADRDSKKKEKKKKKKKEKEVQGLSPRLKVEVKGGEDTPKENDKDQ